MAPRARGQAPEPGEREPNRYALVVGNAVYSNLATLNSVNSDLAGVAEKLRALKFDVTVVQGLPSVRQFEEDVLPVFRRKVSEGDLVVFYFSGHGFSYGPHNFLAPADLPVRLLHREVAERAIAVESIEYYLARAKPGLMLLLVDACRTIGGFVIQGDGNSNAVGKGTGDPARMGHRVNTFVGYAAKSGTAAFGSSIAGQNSLFTRRLVVHLDTDGVTFSRVFDEIIADFRQEDDDQEPGILDWSATELFLRPSSQQVELEKEAWRSAYTKADTVAVRRFIEMNSISRYAASARSWLANNQKQARQVVPPVSPVAVERAWAFDTVSRTVASTFEGFAFGQSVRLDSTAGLRLSNADLGVAVERLGGAGGRGGGGGGGGAALPADDRFYSDLRALVSHGNAVVTRPFVAIDAPSAAGKKLRDIEPGTPIMIYAYNVDDRRAAWAVASVQGENDVFYLGMGTGAASRPPVRVGQSLSETIVYPHPSGMRSLVDTTAVSEAVRRARKDGQRVERVSLAIGQSEDPEENEARLARLTHVEYLLRRSGIDASRITAVEGARDVDGPGVRLRFFGFSAPPVR